MKKMIFVLIMITAAVGAFATGQQEMNDEGVVELNRADLARNSSLSDLEEIELTGTVLFESPVAELKVGSKQYTLMAPGAMAFSGFVSEGDKITVTGYLMDEDSMPCGAEGPMGNGARFQDFKALDGNIVVLVETVEIDGTVYELPWVENGIGGRGGRRPGMKGGTRGQNGGMRQSF